MNPLNWLLCRRVADKEQEKLDKVKDELRNNSVIAELAAKNPEMQENLKTLGVTPKTSP